MKISKYGAEHILLEKLATLGSSNKGLLREMLLALFGDYLYGHAVKSYCHMLHELDQSIIVDESLKVDKSRFRQKYNKLNGTQMRLLAKAVKDIAQRSAKNQETLEKKRKIIKKNYTKITDIENQKPLI